MSNSLRVLHIIPAAFEYFDDIKDYAFGLVGEMNSYNNIVADVFTLQYSSPTRLEKASVEALAPEQEYVGLESVEEAVDDFSSYDIIHLHAPFLGGAKRIMQWKDDHPEVPLIITYYRSVDVVDLIALGIRWYNNYYLNKLFKRANFITVFPWSEKRARQIAARSGAGEKIELLDEFKGGNSGIVLHKHLKQKELVKHFFNLYGQFI